MSRKSQVFNSKGKFEARNRISSASGKSRVAPRNPFSSMPDSEVLPIPKESGEAQNDHHDTEYHVLKSCRVRVLKPDPDYLEKISDRLAALEKRIQSL